METKQIEVTREALLKKQKLRMEKVALDKDSYVYIREMTGRERDRFEQSIVKITKGKKGVPEQQQDLKDFRAKLVVCSACDHNGELLFTANDVEALSSTLSASKFEKMVNVAQKLSGITEEDKEELIKN